MSEKPAKPLAVGAMPALPVSMGGMEWNRTGEWRFFDPIHENHLPPCSHACPAENDIRRFISLMLHKEYREAYDVIRESNPLPAICGRVCSQTCLAECNRAELDDAVLIRSLERFVGDWGLKNVKTQPAKIDPTKGEIAVVGAGPAGLSAAWQLANLGYKVTIFESSSRAGGMLSECFPGYRLPRKILESEIHSLLDRGIELRLSVKLGRDLQLSDLQRFRAVLLAIGAHKPRELDIPGADLSGVQSGLQFLSEISRGKRSRIDGAVAIIGGSNTALQCARAVVRLGGVPSVYFRRSAAEISAFADQIEEAREEGIEIACLVAPKAVQKAGRLFKLTLQRLTLGKKDSAGKRVAVSIRGAQSEVMVARIIVALGEDPDLTSLPPEFRRESWGLVTDGTYQTSIDNFFAAGDCAANRRGVANAIGAGRAAAQSIDRYLLGASLFEPKVEHPITRFANLNTAYFHRIQVTERKRISESRRLNSFAEVSLGLLEAEALREAARCMSCGVCNGCDNCLTYCPDHAVSRDDGRYVIDYNHCKGCGICIHECPRDAIHLRIRQVPR